MGKTVADQRWIHPDRVIDYHVMIFGLTGCMQVVEDDQEYFLHPCDLLFPEGRGASLGLPQDGSGNEQLLCPFLRSFGGSVTSKGEYRYFPDQPSFAREDHYYSMTIPKQIGIKGRRGLPAKGRAPIQAVSG